MGLCEYFYMSKATAQNARNIAAIIGANARRASRSGRKVREMQQVIAKLEEDLDFLILVVLTLYATLHEKGLITRDALLRRIEEIDLYDGRKDGKVSPAALRRAFGFGD